MTVKRSHPQQGQLSFLWGIADTTPERAEHEPVRGESAGALEEVAPAEIQPDRRPGQLLLGVGGSDSRTGDGAGPRPGGRRPAAGTVPRESGSPADGARERRVAGAAGAGFARAGAELAADESDTLGTPSAPSDVTQNE